MNDVAIAKKPLVVKPTHKVRFVTAASLFDGHDASINIMRRILQATGCEVIHLGHNRSVEEIVTAALQEDAHGIAISSYQGGHVEFFKYMLDLLRERGGGDIKVFGGGGGVIIPVRDRRAARVRRHAHLLARGRPAARPAGDDQRDRHAPATSISRRTCRRIWLRSRPATRMREPTPWRASSPASKPRRCRRSCATSCCARRRRARRRYSASPAPAAPASPR